MLISKNSHNIVSKFIQKFVLKKEKNPLDIAVKEHQKISRLDTLYAIAFIVFSLIAFYFISQESFIFSKVFIALSLIFLILKYSCNFSLKISRIYLEEKNVFDKTNQASDFKYRVMVANIIATLDSSVAPTSEADLICAKGYKIYSLKETQFEGFFKEQRFNFVLSLIKILTLQNYSYDSALDFLIHLQKQIKKFQFLIVSLLLIAAYLCFNFYIIFFYATVLFLIFIFTKYFLYSESIKIIVAYCLHQGFVKKNINENFDRLYKNSFHLAAVQYIYANKLHEKVIIE